MGSSILPLRSFVLLASLGVLASDPPASGGSPVDRGPDSASNESDTRRSNANAESELTENWYRFFCGPGWDPAVTRPCGIHGNGASYHGCANSAEASGA